MIIYIHGYNSDGLETSEKIRAGTDIEVVRAGYRYKNADEALFDISKTIDKHKSDDVLLVGTSLGGFWANYFAELWNMRCVLINPTPTPSTSLLKYQPEAESYRKYESEPAKNVHRHLIIGMEDKIVSPQAVVAHYKECNPQTFFFMKEGHRFVNFEPISTIITIAHNTYS